MQMPGGRKSLKNKEASRELEEVIGSIEGLGVSIHWSQIVVTMVRCSRSNRCSLKSTYQETKNSDFCLENTTPAVQKKGPKVYEL